MWWVELKGKFDGRLAARIAPNKASIRDRTNNELSAEVISEASYARLFMWGGK